MSSLSKWRAADAEREPAPPHDHPHKELARLKRENEILGQERDLLKRQQTSPSIAQRG